jgi:hypothetical protein
MHAISKGHYWQLLLELLLVSYDGPEIDLAQLLDISPMASAYNQYYLPFQEIHEPQQFAKGQ